MKILKIYTTLHLDSMANKEVGVCQVSHYAWNTHLTLIVSQFHSR